MLLQDILDQGFRSVSIIGLGKNTGKTFSFNHLLQEARQLGIQVAMTTIGLDGEEQDSLFYHDKPKIVIYPGDIVANASSLLIESGLDYEVLGSTDIMTPLGEVILARVLSRGRTLLSGPSTARELALVKSQLETVGIDLFLVDGAIDRRSLAAPMVTDTTILAVGAEVSLDIQYLLDKVRQELAVLNLPEWDRGEFASLLRDQALGDDVKLVVFSKQGLEGQLTQQEFFGDPQCLTQVVKADTETVFIRGILTDEVLDKVLGCQSVKTSFSLLVTDPACVFLSRQGFQRLETNGLELEVLHPIHLSAVTVNPFHRRAGLVDPLRLLNEVGQAAHPLPVYDLNLGLRFTPAKEAFHGTS